MYSFMRQQEVVEVCGVRFGGQPGENPTVLFGTLFYGKEFKVLDDATLTKAKDLVLAQDKLSKDTGLPALVDVYVKDEKLIDKQLNLVLDSTDLPFSVDSSDGGTRAACLKYAAKAGVLDRLVYNSINLGLTGEELKALGKHTPACAIVLAYNPRDMSVDGRLDMLATGAGMLKAADKGLLDVAGDVGIEKLLLDTGATPFGSMSAETLRAIPVLKNEYGLPVGCSIHNTLESWGWMRDLRKRDMAAYECADAAANSMVPLSCGDFIVYGPITSAAKVMPSVAFAEKLVAEGARDYFGVDVSKEHQYYKLE
jgi:tetrahydromethanopterin S-methyltransferase subunit H